jgi:hypothetical protein
MLKSWLPWLVFAAMLLWTPTRGAKLAAGSDSGALPLELVLRADRKVYRMSDTLRLETQLRNIGEKDVYIWEWDMCWNPARGLSMRIIGADGKYVQSRVLLDCVPPPPRSGDPYQFVKLAPETFYGHAEGFKLSDLVNKPGEYDFFATFSSFLSSQWVAEGFGNDPISKLLLWTMERPVITSKRIHITVNP